MRLIGKVYINGEYRILFDEKATVNPYRIVFIWHNNGRHQKTVNKYADLKSCLFEIADSI